MIMSFSSAPALVSASTAPSISLPQIKSLNRLATMPNFIPLATSFPSMILGIFSSLPLVILEPDLQFMSACYNKKELYLQQMAHLFLFCLQIFDVALIRFYFDGDAVGNG